MNYNKIFKNTFFTLDDKLQLLHLIFAVVEYEFHIKIENKNFEQDLTNGCPKGIGTIGFRAFKTMEFENRCTNFVNLCLFYPKPIRKNQNIGQ